MAELLLTYITATSGVALIPLAVASIAASSRLFAYLKTVHPAIWSQLGQPSIWRGNRSASSQGVRYFTMREYRKVPDPELQRRGHMARILLYLAAGTFLTFTLSALALDAVGA